MRQKSAGAAKREIAVYRQLTVIAGLVAAYAAPAAEPIKIGIIGLDTSHVTAFTKDLNDPNAKPDLAGVRVVAAYPPGSKDIPSSVNRRPGYIEAVKKMGVEIVDSIDDLLKRVDCVLLESNDGRPHAEQVLPVLKAGKPVFIDKPVAGSLVDAVRIYDAAEYFKVPVFSSSSLRYGVGAQALRAGKAGHVLGADAYGPCELEAHHPDFFWYGIHGVETLYTVMGTGCQTVVRVHTKDADVAVGTWSGGRIGTFRGIRAGKSGYGGTAFGEKATEPIGGSGGYRPLVVNIVEFFRTRTPPVDPKETLELYAFMEAADESKRQGGKPVSLREVMNRAVAAARQNPLR
jgi:Oxidoreductase family, NAD-binding Rossmann fold